MTSRRGRILISSVVLVTLLIGLGLLSHVSFAGKGKFVPHKLVILFSGDDRGQLKPPCG